MPGPSGAAWPWCDDGLDEWGAGNPPDAPRTMNGLRRAASHPGHWPGSHRTAAILPKTAASRKPTRVRVPPRNYSVATPPGYRRKLTSPLFGNLPVAIAFVNEKIHKILRLPTSGTTSPSGYDLAHCVARLTQSRVSEHESDGPQTVFSARPGRARSQPAQTVRNRRTTSSSSSPIAPQATERPLSRMWKRSATRRASGSFCSTSRTVKRPRCAPHRRPAPAPPHHPEDRDRRRRRPAIDRALQGLAALTVRHRADNGSHATGRQSAKSR